MRLGQEKADYTLLALSSFSAQKVPRQVIPPCTRFRQAVLRRMKIKSRAVQGKAMAYHFLAPWKRTLSTKMRVMRATTAA
jgi:hypothetical protein